MNVAILLAIIESIGNDLFAIAVGEEIDRASGDDTDERGSETLKQCPW